MWCGILALWACGAPAMAGTVAEAFPPPPGAVRIDGGAFGTWLGALDLRAADIPVTTHDGRTVHHHARVVELPLVPGDLQQCADSAIRLRATWERETGGSPSFHATSGDPIPWSRYADGESPYVVDDAIRWRPGGDRSFEGWLRKVFIWAGSASLARHDTVAASSPKPGDVMVQGGFPGHVVVLLDVAVRDGKTFVLVGEGFMPAQDFHVELGPHGGWWSYDDGLDLPFWSFEGEHLRRWR